MEKQLFLSGMGPKKSIEEILLERKEKEAAADAEEKPKQEAEPPAPIYKCIGAETESDKDDECAFCGTHGGIGCPNHPKK